MALLATAEREPVIAPLPNRNEVDAAGPRSRQEVARSVLSGHSAGLDARRHRDLLSEELLLHIDGSGHFQWADILYDQRVAIPRLISEFRKTENLLRLVVDNAVARASRMPPTERPAGCCAVKHLYTKAPTQARTNRGDEL